MLDGCICAPCVPFVRCGVFLAASRVRWCYCSVLLSLSYRREWRKFRLCWLFVVLGVFLCGRVAFVRSVAKFKALTVALVFPFVPLLRSAIRFRCSRAVPSVAVGKKWIPPPLLYIRAWVCGVTSPYSIKKLL